MLKSVLLTSALLASAPLIAQTTATPSPATNPAQPSTLGKSNQTAQPTTNAPQPTTDTTPATQGTSGSSASTTTTPAPAGTAGSTNPADAVATVVSTDWSKYDADSNQNLSKAEFAKWMIALREQNAAAQKDEVKDVNAWANAAFGQADKDKSGAVTKPELEGFLKG